jgi:hydroxymethylbilane synthase
MATLTYATRRSALALAQCRAFVDVVRRAAPGNAFEELQVVTSGDRIQDRPLSEVGGKGLFVKEIEEALLDGRADFAVHSIKDVPAHLPEGLLLACVPTRADPRDALVSPRHGTLEALPQAATVGTSSLRRSVSLLRLRPDLRVVPLRGNVDTRLRKVDGGECDAIVLAYAGLLRLGLAARATEVLSIDASLPAPGQGALGVECRAADASTRALLAQVAHAETAVCVAAERGVMRALEGDCKTPIAAHARRVTAAGGDRLHVRAFVAAPDGSGHREGEADVAWPSAEADASLLGESLGARLRAGGQC